MNKIFSKLLKKSNKIKEDNRELTPEEQIIREKFEKEFYFKTVLAIFGTAIFLVFVFSMVFY